MRRSWATGGLLGLLLCGAGYRPAFAGDSLYGRVTAVTSAETVTFEYGEGRQYQLRLIGIEVPQEGPLANVARQAVSNIVLGKNVRMRFEGRAPNGEMRSRLFINDPVLGVREVGVELVKAGLARRQEGFDFKYGELAAAETEARRARRGLWAATQPQ